MYEGSCTSCGQKYNLPPSEEEIEDESKDLYVDVLQEEREYGEEYKDSDVTSLLPLSQVEILSDDGVYDGENLILEATDLYVNQHEAKNLDFNEQLFIMDCSTTKKIGSMTIEVDYKDDTEFYVKLHYFFSKGSNLCEVYNYGYVRKNFESSIETRFEMKNDVISSKDTVHRLHVTPVENGYFFEEQYRYNKDHFIKNYTELNYDSLLNLVTESANIVLMRQMAQKDFVGFKSFKSVLTNREICTTQVKAYRFKWCIVNNKETELKKIRRRMILPTKEIQESIAYISRNGQIVTLIWCGDEQYAIINPEFEVIAGHRPKNPYYLLTKKVRFLNLPYVKRKIKMDTNRQIMKSKNYIADHPEITAIISFICKQILLTKPHKVILFVKRYILPYL